MDEKEYLHLLSASDRLSVLRLAAERDRLLSIRCRLSAEARQREIDKILKNYEH